MPLALGHLAVGLLTDCAIEKPGTTTRKRLSLLFLLVNSPDIDILISWLATGSLYAYHRTFTHSILFAVIMAAVVSNATRFWPSFPRLSYKWSYWMVMSHVIADYLITPWEVAFLWPLPFQPGALNGVLDHVSRYASLAREAEVLCICLFTYLLVKALGTAFSYLQKLLLPV